MGLERIGQIIFGIITVLFLFAALPTFMTLISNAGIVDPVLQGAAFLTLFIFVVVVIYVAFRGEQKPEIPTLMGE